MKKILCAVLALVMLLSFAACASSADKDAEGNDAESDLQYVLDKGKLTIGYTVYEPMNYTDSDGNFTGFDTEFAEAVCEKLGVEPDFVEIIWETKEVELNAKSIDCIWNGLTIDSERAQTMSLSDPYVKNAQVIVVKADSDIKSTADLADKSKTVVAEIGSAGENQILGSEDVEAEENLAKATYVGMTKQADCLMEVKSGTADAAVLDWTLASSMVGEGTDFADLKMIDGLELATEEYGIAFRKGSDITAKVNEIIAEQVKDGTLPALAEKYGLSLAPEIAG